MTFRDNLLHLRRQRNMTQEQLAMLLGVSRQSVAKWEAGQSTPEVDKLLKLSELFGCTLDELVRGDLSTREVAPAEVLPEGAPTGDVCGYDTHIRAFARSMAVGVAIIVAGLGVAVLLSALLDERLAEGLAPVAIIGFVAVSLVFILPAAFGHASFAEAHPFVEDFYTPEQRTAERAAFARLLSVGIVIILAGVSVVVLVDTLLGEETAEYGAAGMLALIAPGVGLITYGGIVHGLSDVDAYNRERADEQWERSNPRVDRICGIIMLVATAVGLLLLFGGTAAAQAGYAHADVLTSYFWVVWPIGGIICAIATLALRNGAER